MRTGEWVGDCFLYTNSTNRLNYLVGDQTYTVSHFDQPMYILGYIQRDSRIYLCDKDVAVTSFALSLPVLEYQTLVLRDELEAASELLPSIPEGELNKVARFLDGQGHKELALEVATDPEHKFELALALNRLDIALELAKEANVEHRWKTGKSLLRHVSVLGRPLLTLLSWRYRSRSLGRQSRRRMLHTRQRPWLTPASLLVHLGSRRSRLAGHQGRGGRRSQRRILQQMAAG